MNIIPTNPISIIRATRIQKGYSQEYMAYCLEISQNAYSRLELGQTSLTVDRLLEISDILNIEPEIILEECKTRSKCRPGWSNTK